MTLDALTALVRTAHADAWEIEGRVRGPYGGGWTRVRGARLMASGIPQVELRPRRTVRAKRRVHLEYDAVGDGGELGGTDEVVR